MTLALWSRILSRDKRVDLMCGEAGDNSILLANSLTLDGE